ncbi:MAG: CDP-glycerol glycerophosphotransferase family protein [Ferruginibacter sp.]
MWEIFSGNGLFVFSDPAGAKACLALDEILNKENIFGERRSVSNKHYSFYQQFNSKVEIIEKKDIQQFINQTNVNWVFTGTSHPDSSGGFELLFLKNVKSKTYSFIDHWTNFKLRFTHNNDLIYPDIIFVLDDMARELAIADGLPAEKIALFQNPYLFYLREYAKPTLSRAAFYKKLNIPANKKIVLYAPDPLSLRQVNFVNEHTILEELLDLSENNFTLLLKLHPLQPLERVKKVLNTNSEIKIIRDDDFLPVDVFKNVDCIIGFYSNYLLEASTVNKNIIRYQVNSDQPDYLNHTLKSVLVKNKSELELAIKKCCE